MRLEGNYQTVMLNPLSSLKRSPYLCWVMGIVINYGVAVTLSLVLEASLGSSVVLKTLFNPVKGYSVFVYG